MQIWKCYTGESNVFDSPVFFVMDKFIEKKCFVHVHRQKKKWETKFLQKNLLPWEFGHGEHLEIKRLGIFKTY